MINTHMHEGKSIFHDKYMKSDEWKQNYHLMSQHNLKFTYLLNA
jgi:hypothetical protein